MNFKSTLLLLLTFFILACSSSDKDSKNEEKLPPISVSFKNESRTILIDESYDLFQDLEIKNTEPENIVFYNEDIKTVSMNKGTITGLKKGTTKITARAKNTEITSTISILVDERKITFLEEEIELTKGEFIDLSKLIELTNIKPEEVVWTSEDIEIASLNKAILTANKEGIVNIKATFKETKNCATLKIKIVHREIKFTQEALELTKGYQVELKKLIELKNLEAKDITWEFEHDKIATVIDLKLRGLAPGTTILTARYKDTKVSAKLKLTVHEKGIVLKQDTASVLVGEELDLKQYITVENTDISQLTWTIDNPKIATLTNSTVKGLIVGETLITIKIKNTGVTKQLKLTVKEQKLYFTKESIELIGKDSFDLFTILKHENINKEDIEWEDLNRYGVYIKNGIITANYTSTRPLEISLNISVKNKPFTATLKIFLSSRIPTQIIVPSETIEIDLFEQKYIKVQLLPNDASISQTDWGIPESPIIKTKTFSDTKGLLVEAIALGETNVTITATNGVKASFKVRVKGKDELKFKFDYTYSTLGFASNQNNNSNNNYIRYTVYPREEISNLIWLSNNPNIRIDNGRVTYTEGINTKGIITVIHPKYPNFKESINVVIDKPENIIRPKFDYHSIQNKDGQYFGNVYVRIENNTNTRIVLISDVHFVDKEGKEISNIYAGIGNIGAFFTYTFTFSNIKLKDAYLKYNLYFQDDFKTPIPQKIPLNFKL